MNWPERLIEFSEKWIRRYKALFLMMLIAALVWSCLSYIDATHLAAEQNASLLVDDARVSALKDSVVRLGLLCVAIYLIKSLYLRVRGKFPHNQI